jgi:hypothetical protein
MGQHSLQVLLHIGPDAVRRITAMHLTGGQCQRCLQHPGALELVRQPFHSTVGWLPRKALGTHRRRIVREPLLVLVDAHNARFVLHPRQKLVAAVFLVPVLRIGAPRPADRPRAGTVEGSKHANSATHGLRRTLAGPTAGAVNANCSNWPVLPRTMQASQIFRFART